MSINRTSRTFAPVLMEEEYWANSQLSVARHYGGIKLSGVNYYIVNKEGKDLFECSAEAEREGREKAIEPGEPADLVDARKDGVYKGQVLDIAEHLGRPISGVRRKIMQLIREGRTQSYARCKIYLPKKRIRT